MPHCKTYIVLTAIVCTVMLIPLADTVSALNMNIEIDYMVLRDQNNNILHSHRPSQAEVDAVEQMFACKGHNLNIVIDDEIPHVQVIPQNPIDKSTIFGVSFDPNSFYLMKLTYFDNSGGGWHYCIFGHQYQLNDDTTGSSGLAEFGDDLVVTLGAFIGQIGTPFDRASTLAHEFGHNLGLGHCGAMDCGVVGPGPIVMPSIMSYNFQLDGVRSNLLCLGLAPESANLFKEMDYSEGRLCSLYETDLMEWFGTGMVSVDWDCDGTISGTASYSLDSVYLDDGWCSESSGSMIWVDYDEWANITDPVLTYSKSELDAVSYTFEPCISYEEIEAKRRARGACPQPTLTTEDCVGGDIVFLRSGYGGVPTGACVTPFPTLSNAIPFSSNGSVLYFREGLYNEPGSDLIVEKPLIMSSVGNTFITTSSTPNLTEETLDSTVVPDGDGVVKE